MSDQIVEIEVTGFDQPLDGQQVGALPLGSNADRGLAHEGRGKRERQRLGIEAGEHDFAARGQAPDQAVEQACVAADVIDCAIVVAIVVFRAHDRIAFGALRADRIGLPDRRGRMATQYGQARKQTTEHTVANDQVGRNDRIALAADRDCVIGRGGQRQKNRLIAKCVADLDGALGGHDDLRGRPAEEALDFAVAAGAWHEDGIADIQSGP